MLFTRSTFPLPTFKHDQLETPGSRMVADIWCSASAGLCLGLVQGARKIT